MAITSLPDATVRLLGSAQTLTTPTSLIKELIDNSLDAHATSVEIYISHNTLDKVEVRDNGNGIPQEDFDALGKRGHTSKLRSFDELKSIGGISLGFRGEALFSAVQLGKVSITSKSDGEQVATLARFKVGGGIETLTTSSHPTGTTVCVTDFLHSIPVRKQTSLKEAPKTLGKIKELLRAYSLARPHVKFSLKSSKNSKGSWSYSPRRNIGIREAVSQAIGRDVASQCMEKSTVFPEIMYPCNTNNEHPPDSATNLPSTNSNQFIIDMFLPKPGADLSKISHGQYISIDSRPMSHEKGTMKRITTMFKHYIKNILPDTSSKILNPFLRLSIKCPIESYDPNIEPAKDDVIFINEDLILKWIEKMFIDIYGKNQSSRGVSGITEDQIPDEFETLLSRGLSADSQIIEPQSMTAGGSCSRLSSDRLSLEHNNLQPSATCLITGKQINLESLEARKTGTIDMSENFTEYLETPVKRATQIRHNLSTPESLDDTSEVNSTTLNPWSIAKSSFSKQKIGKPYNFQSSRGRSNRDPLLTPHSSSDPSIEEFEILDKPAGTSQKERHTICNVDRGELMQNTGNPSADMRSNQNYKDLNSGQISAVDSDEELFVSENKRTPHRRDFVSAINLIDSHELPISSLVRSRQLNNSSKIFKSPLKRQKESQKSMNKTLIIDDNISRKRYEENEKNDENEDLAWSIDYERRKEKATKQLREEIRLSQSNHTSPHQNRYNAAKLALDGNIQFGQQKVQTTIPIPKIKTSISDDDPRGYFIRRQNCFLYRTGEKSELKISKAKYSRLPLERIPPGQELHKHLLNLCINTKQILEVIKLFDVSDECIQKGNNENAFVKSLSNLSEKDKDTMISAIKYVVQEWKKSSTATDEYEIEYDFNSLIVSET